MFDPQKGPKNVLLGGPTMLLLGFWGMRNMMDKRNN